MASSRDVMYAVSDGGHGRMLRLVGKLLLGGGRAVYCLMAEVLHWRHLQNAAGCLYLKMRELFIQLGRIVDKDLQAQMSRSE